MTLSLIAACLPAAYARRPFVCLSVCRASQFDDFIVSNMIYLSFPPSHHLLPQWPSSRRCSASLQPSCSFSSLELEGDPRRALHQGSTAWNRVGTLPLCLGFSSAFLTCRALFHIHLSSNQFLDNSTVGRGGEAGGNKRAAPTVLAPVLFIPSPLPNLSSLFSTSLISLFCSLAPFPPLLFSL